MYIDHCRSSLLLLSYVLTHRTITVMPAFSIDPLAAWSTWRSGFLGLRCATRIGWNMMICWAKCNYRSSARGMVVAGWTWPTWTCGERFRKMICFFQHIFWFLIAARGYLHTPFWFLLPATKQECATDLNMGLWWTIIRRQHRVRGYRAFP